MDHWLLEDSNNSEHEIYTEIGGPTSITNHENSSTAYMNNDECMEIWNILKSWKLESVYQTCIDQLIDVEVLKYMKYRHIEKLLVNFPLGTQIKFEEYVNGYQQKQLELGCSVLETKSIPSTSTQHVVSSNSSTKNLPENCFDLSQILTRSTQGPLIVDYYFKHKHLNESCRTLLVEIIINDLIKRNQTMTINLSNDIANAILLSFPSEIKDVYFLRDVSCKAPKGKIYSKYFNTMKKLQSVGLKSNIKTHENNKKIVCRSEDQLNYSLEIEPESEDLCVNLQDPDLSWPEIETIWKKTTNFRLQYIKNNNTASIFKKWIQFTQPMGYKLVEIDFCHMYSNFKNLSAKFEKKSSLLLKIFDERIKDNASKILLNQLKESTDLCENGKNLVIFYLMHSLFVPSSRKITRDDNGKKSVTKYSIKDSQNTFIIEASTPVELEVIIEKLKKQENNIQPCILVVGSLLSPKQIIVYFDDVKYKLFSVFKAIDICFKLFHVFNLEYPYESSNVWLFLQNYFYEINTKYDKSCSLIKQICSELDANYNI